ncbi:hypothetical protein GGR55DRAFT_703979, partial [Xylaria sp. FL0064]
ASCLQLIFSSLLRSAAVPSFDSCTKTCRQISHHKMAKTRFSSTAARQTPLGVAEQQPQFCGQAVVKKRTAKKPLGPRASGVKKRVAKSSKAEKQAKKRTQKKIEEVLASPALSCIVVGSPIETESGSETGS